MKWYLIIGGIAFVIIVASFVPAISVPICNLLNRVRG